MIVSILHYHQWHRQIFFVEGLRLNFFRQITVLIKSFGHLFRWTRESFLLWKCRGLMFLKLGVVLKRVVMEDTPSKRIKWRWCFAENYHFTNVYKYSLREVTDSKIGYVWQPTPGKPADDEKMNDFLLLPLIIRSAFQIKMKSNSATYLRG